MKDESNNFNLSTLKEMIIDEHKLVTYISLSKDLCIHVNQSKIFLSNIVDIIRKEDPTISLNINYILSGIVENNKVEITVCNEKDLIQYQAKYRNIFFQHIYSVGLGQSSNSILDKVSLLAVNKFIDIPLCSGLIKNISCIKRPPRKTQNHDLIINEKKDDPKIDKNSNKNIFSKNGTSNSTIKIDGTNSKPNIKTEITSPKKDTKHDIANGNSFVKIEVTKSKTNIKTESISPKKESMLGKRPGNKNKNKSQKGIASFFNATGPNVENLVNKKKEKLTDDLKEPVSVEKTEKMDIDVAIPSNKEISHNVKQQGITTTKKINKSLDQIKKMAKVDKKRKRVIHVSDSGSDEENDPFMEEPPVVESDDEIPATPMANTVKITSGIVNPKKKRKVVDKTYTDEDGFILTKKVEVYESCSENEEELCAKENVQTMINKVSPKGKKSQKKINSPQKGKQATIMNFFKRK